MPELSFEDLVDSVRLTSAVLGPKARMVIHGQSSAFVPPKLKTSSDDALAAEVLLIRSPAAVGKTTLARQLAAHRQLPLLDLASVPVSTHSLAGLIQSDLLEPVSPAPAFHRAELPLVVDALDEGRLLSGEQNFEGFLETTWELLLHDRSVRDQPKLILLGRNETIELVTTSLEISGQGIKYSVLDVSFFDESAARQLIDVYAKLAAKPDAAYHGHPIPATAAVDAYFFAIAAALGVRSEDLFRTDNGRAFAGYAPVLAALGSLLARVENFQDVSNRLRSAGVGEAWDVIELVAREILEREQKKLCDPLRAQIGEPVPDQAYDIHEQLVMLVDYVYDQSPRETGRVVLNPANLSRYHALAARYVPEHPFLKGREWTNPVLASMALAHAVWHDLLRDGELTGLRDLSRQPFLWRSLRSRVEGSEDALLDGRYLGCVLNSMWSDPLVTGPRIRVRPSASDEMGGHALIEESRSRVWRIGITLPVEFFAQLLDADIEVHGPVKCQAPSTGGGESAFYFRGNVRMKTPEVELAAERVVVSGRVGLNAERVMQSSRLALQLVEGSQVEWRGDFEQRYPWNRYPSTLTRSDDGDLLAQLVEDCWLRLPPSGAMTLTPDYRPAGDVRLRWVEREYPVAFPALIRRMIGAGLATTSSADTAGQALVRVHFDFRWADVLQAVHESAGTDVIAKVLSETRRDLNL